MIIRDDLSAKKHELLTLSTGNVYSLNSAVYTLDDGTLPSHAIIGPIEGNDIRYTIHGVDPVVATKVGHSLDVADFLQLESSNDIKNFRVVRGDATTAYIPVTYRY